MYKDTFGYFGQSEFRQMLIHNLPVEKFKTVLEIGSYEGIFSCFAAQSFAFMDLGQCQKYGCAFLKAFL